ncbi:MAG TPA: hypothetical protein VF178_04675 [Gemmatimonadaceae bacterium]
MTSTRLAIGFVVLLASSVSAQSMPPVTKAKRAAERAVAATNAHTAAMTSGAQTSDSVRSDSTARRTATGTAASRGPAGSAARIDSLVNFEREVFRYERAGRRDPFVSLMESGDLRPLLIDLVVVGIVYDPRRPVQSVAVLRDETTKLQYRVRVGDSVGRNRVARINEKSVTFTIEEFGFSRQETLQLTDANKERVK